MPVSVAYVRNLPSERGKWTKERWERLREQRRRQWKWKKERDMMKRDIGEGYVLPYLDQLRSGR